MLDEKSSSPEEIRLRFSPCHCAPKTCMAAFSMWNYTWSKCSCILVILITHYYFYAFPLSIVYILTFELVLGMKGGVKITLHVYFCFWFMFVYFNMLSCHSCCLLFLCFFILTFELVLGIKGANYHFIFMCFFVIIVAYYLLDDTFIP